jgi:DivIVA domain-containing protein
MPLTPEDVQSKRFTSTRFRPGYDEDEVDAFLDEVEAELTRMHEENEALRARLAAVAAAPAPPPPPAPEEIAAPPAPAAAEPVESQETALRTLLLAQRTADEAIAEARKEAERLVTEARTRAAGLEQQARDNTATATAEFDRKRRELERQLEDLRAFEREYRTRLKAYLETQLRELEGRGATPPAAPTDASTPTPAPPASPAVPRPVPPASGGASPFRPPPFPGGGEPDPSAPPRQAEGVSDLPPGGEVDEGPEIAPE